ncbi:MAG: hypothetical protein GYB30_02305 [Gammaproteobacteria bacterium]|nr:hypothetical protein [Gammaproteobacteria bacterium]
MFRVLECVQYSVAAAAFYEVGQAFEPGSFGHTVGSGLAGGVMNELFGGNFGHGFLSAGISAMASGTINGIKSAGGRIVASAIVGGTVSKLTGGKFANGAATAAFGRALGEASLKNASYSGGGKGEPITSEEKEKFAPEFEELKKLTAKKGSFNTSEEAANWLHQNVHSKLTIDVEVGAYIYGSDESGYRIGELTTSYMRDVVDMQMVGQAHSSWHSHGTNSFYRLPSVGMKKDSWWDTNQQLQFGYTSTAGFQGGLWQFDASSFTGPHTYSNVCKFTTNLAGDYGC